MTFMGTNEVKRRWVNKFDVNSRSEVWLAVRCRPLSPQPIWPQYLINVPLWAQADCEFALYE